ncbi:MAG: hypothetical protein HUU15_04880 [Candidatus Brocadiae bacterium]|nr:hypothetical protein [Candidatus Brocadiia bacterium]
MRSAIPVALAVALTASFARAGELSYPQKQAVDRQERNQKEGAKKLKDMQDSYAKEMGQLTPEMLIPPSFFKGYTNKGDEVLAKADAIQADLAKNNCPADDPRVKALNDWTETARAEVAKFRESYAAKQAEMEKLADPKNYPDLDADFKQIDTLATAYKFKGFLSRPELVEELAKEFPQVVTWSQERFKVYRPLIVLTGGKESPLYRRYDAMSKGIKSFQEEATKFFGDAESEVPGFLAKAEEMAAKAAAEKKPAFFSGGVRQQLDQAELRIKVCRALVPADDARLKTMEAAWASSKSKIDASAAGLKDLLIAEARPPAEKYKGGDKEDLRAKVVEAWKAKYPNDEILMTRCHMENFDRRQTATWDSGTRSWEFSDRSVLAITVIVKTSDTVATTYPAFVNVDHIANTTTYGVNTKGNEFVQREMLIANVK